MKCCSNEACPSRQRGGGPAAHPDHVDLCPDCGQPLSPKDWLTGQAWTTLWKRAWVSVGVVALFMGARWIPLPTVRPEYGIGGDMREAWSIMALGLKPWISGYVLVEIVALIVPMWRSLRASGSAGRAKLHRASLIVGMLLTFIQAMTLVIGLESMGVIGEEGAGVRVFTVLILLGASAALVALARIVDGHGLGTGFSILLLAQAIPEIVEPLGYFCRDALSDVIPVSAGLLGIVIISVIIWASLWMFGQNPLPSQASSSRTLMLSRPACGMAPILVATFILAFASHWTGFGNSAQTFGPHSPGFLPALLLLSAATAPLFAFLFNQPKRVAEVWKWLSPNVSVDTPNLKAVMQECIVFIAVIVLMDAWANRAVGLGYLPSAVTIVLVTGILCDIVSEWRAIKTDCTLVPIWEIHQTYAVAPAIRLLEANGIYAFGRGVHLRALLQFFGPYIPVLIMVPMEDGQRAHALISARWPERDVAAEPMDASLTKSPSP